MPSSRKTSRKSSRRNVSVIEGIGRRLDAFPDRIDIRDWVYQPALLSLPDELINCEFAAPILDQGQEGACTGFALAAVINFLLRQRGEKRLVSPRMLYEMARRYDEWPGEKYDGSSARGAMKGWVAHGVCDQKLWPNGLQGSRHFTPERASQALSTPGGAYYRVQQRQVRDVHAALNETGVCYLTIMVHKGWAEPGPKSFDVSMLMRGKKRVLRLPVIAREGRASDGHAVAIIGYNREGFVIQNSWGKDWGENGFALLPYEDFLMHATDVWVAQLGVPTRLDLWQTGLADTTAGLARIADSIPEGDIKPYVINIGNNGLLSDSSTYKTKEPPDVTQLFERSIPDKTSGWQKRRIMLYLHGGLNNEDAVAHRIVAFKDVMMQNEIYPLHIMWETGPGETFIDWLVDKLPGHDRASAEWMASFRDHLTEAKDRTIEYTTSGIGTRMWNEMKENAERASYRRGDLAAMQIVHNVAKAYLNTLPQAERDKWELHVVGHSAGSIFAAYALQHLLDMGMPLKTVQFMAPAIRIELFKAGILPQVQSGACPHPTMYLLSDKAELDDNCHPLPYDKSLLYLVSNAFEKNRGTPLLGMERFVSDAGGSTHVDPEMNVFWKQSVSGLPSLVTANTSNAAGCVSKSKSHGDFGCDPDTLNSIMYRILGGAPPRPFDPSRDVICKPD